MGLQSVGWQSRTQLSHFHITAQRLFNGQVSPALKVLGSVPVPRRPSCPELPTPRVLGTEEASLRWAEGRGSGRGLSVGSYPW